MPSKRRAVLIVSIYISLLLMLFISGCSESNSNNDPYAYTSTRNFYQDEYDPQYRQYEEIIPVDKTTSKTIDIEGTVSSGAITAQVFDPEGKEVQTLTIDKPTEESIPVDEKYGEWKVLISIDEDTEGSISIAN